MSEFGHFACPSCSFSSSEVAAVALHMQDAGHGRPFENGNSLVEKLHDELLEGRTNVLWEVWDFVDRKLVGEFETEKEATSYIESRYAEKFERVRYLVHAPHNVLLFPGSRPGT